MNTQDERFQEVVRAVSGGEIKLVRFLLTILDKIEALNKKTEDKTTAETVSKLDERMSTLNDILRDLAELEPTKAEMPTNETLVELLRPYIPRPVKGDKGDSPSDEYLLDLISPLIPDPIPGPPGLPGVGKPGLNGKTPKHEWNGTRLRFENPDGTWGDFVNLQGPVTSTIEYGQSPSFSSPGVTVRTPEGRAEGVQDIRFGDGFNITKTTNGVSVEIPPTTPVVIKETIGITVDGAGEILTVGSKGFRYMNDAYTITGWHIISDLAGDIVMDVKKAGTSIAGTEKPTLTADNEASLTTLTDWETEIISGDTLEFVIDSNVDITRVTLSILLTKV